MKCVIPGTNCKILGRAIHALARIGDEMYVEPREKSLSLKCVSTSYSAYCEFTFNDNYFSSYNFGDLEEEDALKCKISMRSALTVFKSPAMIDKLVETCHIRLEPNADKLIFVFKFKNSVIKTFFLPIIDCENLSVPYSKANTPNKLSAKSKVLTDAVQNFQQSLVEITMEVTQQKLVMRNYVDETSTSANSTRTQLALTIGEFDEYKIGLDARITFCMKELRALLSFADAVGGPVNIYFETMGKPVIFDLSNPAFEANLVLSTLNPDGDDASVSTAHEVRAPVRKKAAPKKRQPAKAKTSAKKPTIPKRSMDARSNASARAVERNASMDARSNVSARAVERNASMNHTEMEVDQNDDVHVGSNGIRSSRLDSPALQHNSTSRLGPREAAAERAGSVRTSTSCRATSSSRFSPAVASLQQPDGGATEPSIFSPSWKKRLSTNEDQRDPPMDEDSVPGSPPPRKKAKIIFKKCFHTTFDPRMLPGHDTLLADDSDAEN